MKKFVFYLVIASVCMLAISGCSSQSSSSDGKVTLKFFHRWPKEPERRYFEEVVKEFEKEHPDIHIQTEAVLNDSYKDKIKVMLGTSSPPDVFFSWSDEFAAKFIRGNKALDLSSYYKNDTKWSSQLVGTQIKPFTYEEKEYGVPWQMDAKSFFYNKDIFEKLNLKPPSTWEELIKVSKKLKANGYTPISFGTKAPWTISHYIGTLNQRMVDEKTRERDYDAKTGEFTDEGYIKALEKLKELMPYFNEHVNSIDHEYARQQFKSGKSAMMYAETAEIKLVEPVNLGLFSFPDITGQKGSSNALTGAPEGFMISSKTKHPKEAMEFLQFLTSKKMGEKLVKDVGKYSAVQGTATEENSTATQREAVQQIIDADSMVSWFDMDVDVEIADVYLSSIQQMLGGDMTPAEVMKSVQKAAKQVREAAE
ncbi:bacterial extracellular solute-binding family protein [Bacillus atrophaeus subsp. globigii]|uniref:Fructose amino acid-binding lipoprotein n=2 Tax=Bacillus atrophaeus TaxID=1452 RepID=A0ABN3ZFX5_BACA1|nr:extracellular solute-binding protein [Bacillus atrophaeus]AMR61521.1 sugar ABC transporter substrate-binding protein [Bacillus subtilis subsp. globigii]ADP33768.1 putative fructose amino acid-binding lipoprotein [Bacillus atrophaeus 1942]AIK46780.1 bacterial extracellular solute-binding family protein [Bacillus atrophaeus subsp. globigii]EIM10760.1 putative fructose amino acid-binding lipoprotein [Bacillus atrophaeus C89]KFK83411.1 bacterial extracellular solute-binding family protein [Baci